MKKIFYSLLLILVFQVSAAAQGFRTGNGGTFPEQGSNGLRMLQDGDSLHSDKEIPIGLKEWTVDDRFGDVRPVVPDTLSYLFQNTIFTSGLRGEYNFLGNLGSPRYHRIFTDRQYQDDFPFIEPYSYFIVRPESFHFTNTLSPKTILAYNTAGNRTNGEDHLEAKFFVNAGKKLGVGFLFNYLYGRGYYQQQATSLFNFTLYGSFIDQRYQAHAIFSTNHQKVTESGGITDDKYIKNPESFDDNYDVSEIPTVLQSNWNRNDNLHFFFTHRYNVGFSRRVPMTADEIKARQFAMESKKENAKKDTEEGKGQSSAVYEGRPEDAKIAGSEQDIAGNITNKRIQVAGSQAADSLLSVEQRKDTSWTKIEYVPVTAFIHTLKIDTYDRIFQSYNTPQNYYYNSYELQEPLLNDSIYDQTKNLSIKNTLAISLLEGFNKWAKAGLKGFATHQLNSYSLPGATARQSYHEHRISVGGQLSKTQGKLLHYDVTGEIDVVGNYMGKINLSSHADLNVKLGGDTLHLLAEASFVNSKPAFFYRHYHGRHVLWDNDDLSNYTHTTLQGTLRYDKTRTSVRVAVDELTNYTYLSQSYLIDPSSYNRTNLYVQVRQASSPITILTASLQQQLRLGMIHWDNTLTYQQSTNQQAVPVPTLNIYSNLYLRFKIAKVLACDLGADVTYFTAYHGLDYSPVVGMFAVQDNDVKTEIGNYPLVNVYANFKLKRTRFFAMYSHANAGLGNRNYFLVPHYPLNPSVIRFGLSWDFFN